MNLRILRVLCSTVRVAVGPPKSVCTHLRITHIKKRWAMKEWTFLGKIKQYGENVSGDGVS
jgi:hypothetical protein